MTDVPPSAQRPDSTPLEPRPVASVVIPAYDEGRVIARCLTALTAPGAPPLEIVVAANGCTDDTVAVARTFPGVRVLDIATPSKANALTEGDAAAHVFPRIFLDADIELGPGSLDGMIAALTTDEALVAAPSVRFATDDCSWVVRRFYEVYRETPYVRSGLIGLGVYALSAAGRARFAEFPRLQADDLFIQRLFSPRERVTTPGHFVVRAPRDLRNLLKVRTRIARGNAELAATTVDEVTRNGDADFSSTTGSTSRALLDIVRRRPLMAPGVAIYAGVVGLARRRAASDAGRTTGTVWHRDDSTR